MKNYKFSLQSVLEIRDSKEKNALEEFVSAQNRLEEEDRKKRELIDKLDSKLQKSIASKNIQDLIMDSLYRGDLETRIRYQNKIIVEKTKELEKVREKLRAAQKDKKIIEKLKEKDLNEYKTEIQKKKQDEIDEFAVLRFKSS